MCLAFVSLFITGLAFGGRSFRSSDVPGARLAPCNVPTSRTAHRHSRKDRQKVAGTARSLPASKQKPSRLNTLLSIHSSASFILFSRCGCSRFSPAAVVLAEVGPKDFRKLIRPSRSSFIESVLVTLRTASERIDEIAPRVMHLYSERTLCNAHRLEASHRLRYWQRETAGKRLRASRITCGANAFHAARK